MVGHSGRGTRFFDHAAVTREKAAARVCQTTLSKALRREKAGPTRRAIILAEPSRPVRGPLALIALPSQPRVSCTLIRRPGRRLTDRRPCRCRFTHTPQLQTFRRQGSSLTRAVRRCL